ncbi:hypothetical protein GFC01_03190 [Desulfofundulus thermobenzoicus]|uniref:YbbR-like domain-containing protein n=1 Tax=Desulfofundulus thermobenzoicus TaxID=29376 RepID=A0A6N7IMS5_9FIRM|nr:CdaR family protein [Desulfofundulus thermobenzoicus]MQL51282.1 hypothetical protein [Desulfofundulus thermobenzoicus]
MRRPDWRNLSLQVAAVLMALLLWVYVTNEQNPLDERLFNVNLHARGTPADMMVAGLPATVTVRVQGTRGQLTGVTGADFQALVDLSGIEPGDNDLPISVSAPPGVRVLQVSPARVRVQADRMVEKRVPVEVSVKGTPAAGYHMLAPVAEPATVLLKGPGRLVNPQGRVTLSVDVQGATGTVEQVVSVSGLPAEVGFSPRTVRVTIPVTPLPVKEVPVQGRVKGDPGAGYRVQEVQVEPATVQVSAPADVLSGISGVSTPEVDIGGAVRDVVQKVTLPVPGPGVLLRPVEVTVTVRIVPAQPEGPPPTDRKVSTPPSPGQ